MTAMTYPSPFRAGRRGIRASGIAVRMRSRRAAYWDGARIRIDPGFLARARGSGLVAALMHEMAHPRGIEHSALSARRGWYEEWPFRYLDFTDDENFDAGSGRCLGQPTAESLA